VILVGAAFVTLVAGVAAMVAAITIAFVEWWHDR
jgi:hypothetical protein